MAAADRGVARYKVDGAFSHSKQWPSDVLLLDLRKYRTEKLVRGCYADLIKPLQAGSPYAVAMTRIQAGEIPYRVAKELGSQIKPFTIERKSFGSN